MMIINVIGASSIAFGNKITSAIDSEIINRLKIYTHDPLFEEISKDYEITNRRMLRYSLRSKQNSCNEALENDLIIYKVTYRVEKEALIL